ncbi:unnamed protein product [Alopecurus aequalis]
MAPGSKNKKRDTGRIPASELTDDLLVEIFSRMTYRNTVRCKCVCRRWRDVVSHPDNRKKLPQTLAGFFYESEDKNRFPERARHFASVEERYCFPRFDPSLSFLPKCERIDILDCCNGLLLCRRWKSTTHPETLDYVVCNPATEKWAAVPATSWSSQARFARLAFDPAVSSQFHVFEFVTVFEEQKDIKGYRHRIISVRIYSPKNAVWIHKFCGLGISIMLHEGSKSVFSGGMLYLLTFDLVAAVDLLGDTWGVIWINRTPDSYRARAHEIYLSQGQLYMSNIADSKISIWVLEDSTSGKWALTHNVSYSQLPRASHQMYGHEYDVISVHPERSEIFIVCGYSKALISHDMHSGKQRIISHLESDCRTPYFSYVPLFSEIVIDRCSLEA